jgi:hypothetical protein
VIDEPALERRPIGLLPDHAIRNLGRIPSFGAWLAGSSSGKGGVISPKAVSGQCPDSRTIRSGAAGHAYGIATTKVPLPLSWTSVRRLTITVFWTSVSTKDPGH